MVDKQFICRGCHARVRTRVRAPDATRRKPDTVAYACKRRDRRAPGAILPVSLAYWASSWSTRDHHLGKQDGERVKTPVFVLWILHTPVCSPAPRQMCTHMHTDRPQAHTKLSITPFRGWSHSSVAQSIYLSFQRT